MGVIREELKKTKESVTFSALGGDGVEGGGVAVGGHSHTH